MIHAHQFNQMWDFAFIIDVIDSIILEPAFYTKPWAVSQAKSDNPCFMRIRSYWKKDCMRNLTVAMTSFGCVEP